MYFRVQGICSDTLLDVDSTLPRSISTPSKDPSAATQWMTLTIRRRRFSKHVATTSSEPYLKTLFFKIPIVGRADGLPQTFGHSSRGTWSRSVPPLVGSSRQEVPVMRALPRFHFPQNRTNADQKPARCLQTRN